MPKRHKIPYCRVRRQRWQKKSRDTISSNSDLDITDISEVSNVSDISSSNNSITDVTGTTGTDTRTTLTDTFSSSTVGDILFVPLRTSSPVIFNSDVSAASRSVSFEDSDEDDSSNKLFKDSDMTVMEFSKKISELAVKHTFSDAGVQDILQLFACVLPISNKCPTLHKHKTKLLSNVTPIHIQPEESGDVIILPFEEQIDSLLHRYLGIETLHPCSDGGFSDFYTGDLFPQILPKTLYFVINTDGFSPFGSRKIQVWPLLLSVVNLPPKERRKLCNVIMLGYYIGKSKPNWNSYLEVLLSKINTQIGDLSVKVVALVADSPAKAACCFIQNTNAK